MAQKSDIEWTDATWNPLRGCSRVSEGCRFCYAERMSARGLPGLNSPTTGEPFATMARSGPRWTGRVELIESQLEVPLRWKKPRRIFVNSMSDTFHESVPDGWIDRIFGVMALCPQHTFIVLTKRSERMRKYWSDVDLEDRLTDIWADGRPDREMWSLMLPLSHVWLGVSCGDQAAADERIPQLLATPAAVRFVSAEPLLGPVDISQWLRPRQEPNHDGYGGDIGVGWHTDATKLDWVIVGGESGPGARPCRVEWVRNIVRQCREAAVSCFVKQLGSRPVFAADHWPSGLTSALWSNDLGVYDYPATKKGGDPTEWPEDLRVRQFPEVPRG